MGDAELRVSSKTKVPTGRVTFRYQFEPTGKPDIAKGEGSPGNAQLYVNASLVGETTFPHTIPLAIGISGGVAVGRNPGSTITEMYKPPFAFTGTIYSATIDVSGKLMLDTKEQKRADAKVAMARQ